MKLDAWQQQLRTRWALLAPRERGALALAGTIALLALAWWVLLGPALATLRQADAQHRDLDAQLQAMRGLQSDAMALQNQPRLPYDDALRALETSVRQRLGSTAQLSVAGERATLTLKGAEADALARWLTQARVNARALPAEARLTRAAGPATAPARWDGALVLTLPAR
ncbi:type II secretion system protein GspM [Pseudorhodoferax sp. Leaf274]|uniref:type II secretion system protein GspM n=1 Tax=Pseudorhodoferax sp. Leaf274 TaxID=1736318 RepID=UPI0007037C74|nr:type II secretion system protein GspM [Pseudorhodoferax sp. Leaf274]KQP48596.1 general secretion pathway protein GspM [Pseudorhodoferax sp. Leaf274]